MKKKIFLVSILFLLYSLIATQDAFAVTVTTDAELEAALNNQEPVITLANDISYYDALEITYDVTINAASEDVVLTCCSVYSSFISVSNGATLTLGNVGIDLSAWVGSSTMNAIGVQANSKLYYDGATITGGSSSYGIAVFENATAEIKSGDIKGCFKGIVVYDNGVLEFVDDCNINITAGRFGVSFETYSGTCNFDEPGINITGNNSGIVMSTGAGVVNISDGNYSNNAGSGIQANNSGVCNITGGTFNNNWVGIYQRSTTLTITDCVANNNTYGIYLEGGYNGKMTLLGGDITNNTTGCIYHAQTNDATCTVLGGERTGYIVLANAASYVNTDDSYLAFSVRPTGTGYVAGRKLIRTPSNEVANNEIANVTLYPKSGWTTTVQDEYIVLLNGGRIIINCVDEADNSIIKTEIKSGAIDDTYTLEDILIDGYELVNRPTDTLTITAADQTVTYTYRKLNNNLVIKYIDANTNEVIATETVPLSNGESYTASAREIPGYTNVLKPDNENITMGDSDIEITYTYKKTSAGVEVNYIDQVTGDVLETETITGLEKDTYQTEVKDIDGYVLVVTPDNTNGELTVDKITVTYEYRKVSNVTAKYIDENTNTAIVTDVVTEYKEGDAYTTEEKTFDGYTLTVAPDNAVGTVARENIEVVYKYKKTSAGVEVKYIDQATGTVLETETKTGLEKDAYTTTAKDIEGYVLVVTPDNANGEMTVDKITVTYEYRKLSNVTVKYIDENTNTEIITQITTEYKEGDTYTTEEKAFDGYTLTVAPDNATGTVARENIEVVYKYKKTSAGVEVKYIDQATGTVLETETKTGLEKDAYTTTAKDIEGYQLVVTPDNANGEMTVDLITVTYEYRKVSNVTAKYLDENTNTEIVADVVTEYKEGDAYTTEEKTFDGYTLTVAPDNAAGTVARENIEVVYKYKKTSAGVEVKYIDQATGTVLETETKTGLEKDAYTTTAKDIEGYVLVVTPDNANGEMTVDKIIVTYEYRKLSNVTVKYIDENYNTELADQVVTEYKEGDTYTTEEKAFDGYHLTSKTDNTAGTVARENIVVEYRYKKISEGVEIQYKDQVTGEIIKTETIEGLEKDGYTTEPEEIPGYEVVVTPDNADGEMTVDKITVTYEYRKLSNVVVKYIDENTNTEIVADVVTEYKEGDAYTTEEKTFDGYTLTVAPDNAVGTVARENIEVVYKYKKTSAGVEVKYIDQATGTVLETETKTGLEKDAYTTTAKDIEGYQLVVTPDNANGEMTVDKITVTYEYRKVSNVTAKYLDENTNTEIVADVVTEYKEGDAYTTEEKTFDGYTLTVAPDNAVGTVARENIEVVYKYKKTSAGVEVKYIDQATGTVLETETKTGLEKDAYTTTAKDIEGYELVVTPDNANGEMTVDLITVTYEYRKVSNVIVKYIDQNSNTSIVDDVVTKYKEGDTYNTEAKDIDGYKLISEPDNANGVVERENIEVTYKYKKISLGADINFVDQVTGQVLETIHIDGLENDSYTTEAKEIEGYELVKTPDNADGKLTADLTTITYEYRKNSNVIVKYIDENANTEIVDETTTKYKEGDTYTTSAKDIEGYELVVTPDNATGTVEREDIVVEYRYKKVSEGVDVRYIDQATGAELAIEHIDGLENDDYTTEAKDIDGYELVVTPDNAAGKMSADKTTVTYEYRKNSNVIVKYVDENTDAEIADETTTKYKEGDTYTTSAKDIDGYQLTTTPDNTTGTVARENIEVIYKYKKISVGVEVKYIDQTTGDVLETETITGLEKDAYTTEAKDIEGYELVVTPDNAAGELGVDLITVTYEYRKVSNVVAKYIDENTDEEIIASVTNKYKEGDTYTTEEKTFDGYKLTLTPDNATGTVERENIEVVYKYKKISAGVTVRYVDQSTGEELASEVIEGLENEEYTTEAKDIDGYELVVTPDNANGKLAADLTLVTYEYRKLSDVVVKHIDENSGAEITTATTEQYKEGDAYTTEAQTIDGYKLTLTPDNATGTMARENIEVVYGYKKISEGVEIQYKDQVTGEIIKTETIEGLEKDGYTTEPEEIPGYEVVVTPDNANGEMTDGKTTVIYEYRKLSNVTVKYIDENYNTEIIADVVTEYKEGDAYTTEEKTFDGYTLTGKTDNTTGTVEREDIVVEYRYKKVSEGVEIQYKDQVTGEIIKTETIEGLEKDGYTTEPEEIPGYEVVVTPDNANGEMTDGKTTVIYEYRKLSNVITKYVDQNNDIEIEDSEEVSYKEGDTYTTEAKEIEGYKLVKTPDNATGTVAREDIEVVYTYKKVSLGADINFVDQVTGQVLETIHIDGLENDTYTTEAKEIDGYELVKTPENANGNLTTELTTITYEYRKNSNVIVKYIDENNNLEITDEIVTKYKEGDSYTTTEKEIDGYQLTSTTENTEGTVAREDIVVEYRYKKISEGVDVEYIDQETGEVLDKVHIDGLEGDTYTTEAKDIDGYELVVTPDNTTGEMTDGKTNVTYKYVKVSKVVVKFVDQNTGANIADDVITNYKEKEAYTTEAKDIEGYKLVKTPDNATGTIAREDIEVVYTYKKISEGVDINFVDQVTGEVIETVHIDGLEADSYTTEAKEIPGYELVATPDNAAGEMTIGKITVTYEYRKNSNVTVKYIDENYNTELTESVVTKYKEGDAYTTEEKTFDGYQLTSTTQNTEGTVEREDIEVVYGYKKISEGVEVQYKDQVTGEIIKTETIEGLEKDGYTTEPEEIPGYEVVVTPDNANGEMTDGKTTVIYEYRKLSNVIVKYIDLADNTEIMDSIVSEYKEGDTYTTTQKDIDGYEFIESTNNTSGTMEREDIVVEYKYRKISEGVEVKYVDQATGEVLAKETIAGLQNDKYTTEAKDFEGYELVVIPENANGQLGADLTTVTYEYRKNSNVIVKYIDENYNTELAGEVITKYKEGDAYTTEEKTFDGYKLTSTTENTEGTAGREDIVVEYRYKKISEGVEIQYKDQVTGEIIKTETIEGLEKDEYTTEPEEIPGYELVVTPDNTSGEMTEDKITIIYEYKKLSKVIVKYIDAVTKEAIIDDLVTEYKEGDAYTTEEKTIEGYQFISITGNTQGVVEREDIEVIYEYQKISEGVEVLYIDQVTGEPIAVNIVINGLQNEDYTTEAKEIEGYELVVTPDNATGKMTDGKVTVKYEYRKLSNVTTKYIDINTNEEIAEELTQVLKEGEEYVTVAKDIEGYMLSKEPENKAGTVERQDIEVVYYYKRISEGVDVKYIDQSTGEEIASEHIEGLYKDNYTTTAKEIDGYELVKTPENANGEMTIDKITVTYEYKKLSNVITKHIDANTNEVIAEDVIAQYKEGDAYTTSPIDLEGYAVTTIPANKDGVMARNDIEVVYEYKKISEGLVVKYIDEITGELLDTEEYTGNVNDTITLVEKTFDGYELSSKPEVSEVTLTLDPQEERYYYKKVITLNIKAIDTLTGEELSSKTQSGIEGEEYETVADELSGYELVVTPDNATGTYSREDTEVVYEYRKISSGVIVKYVDKDSEELLDEETITGLVEEEYITEKKTYEKYDFVEVVGNPNGKLTDDVIEVTYYYEKKTGTVEIVYVDENGSELLKDILTGKVDEEFKVVEKEIELYQVKEVEGETEGIYTVEKQFVKYIMERIPGKVIVNIYDNEGNYIESVESEGFVGDIAEIELPEKDGYIIIGDNKVEIEYKEGEITVNIAPYQKIELMEPPATGDINIVLYLIMAISSLIIIKRTTLKNSKQK